MNDVETKPNTQTCNPAASRRTTTPQYEVRETGDAFILTVHLPGVDRSALETTVDEETLTLAAQRVFSAPADWTAAYREIPQTDFRLVLQLDRRVNREAVRAELNQGVLTLTLPKSEALKPRRIEISG